MEENEAWSLLLDAAGVAIYERAVATTQQTRTALRGGMTYRSYRVSFPNRAIRVWTYEMPDGKLEQYQVAPLG